MSKILLGSIWITFLSVGKGMATPVASDIFCQKYPKASGCEVKHNSCAICHTAVPTFNSYGQDVKESLPGPIASALMAALDKIESADSDGDGVSNIIEIGNRGAPGNASIKPEEAAELIYDPILAMKRLRSLYCGMPPSFDDLQKVRSSADPRAVVHSELSKCLASRYWKEEALFRMADKKVQPLAAVGFGGNVVIADYRYDYRLFSYVLSDDHDARELLSATYHIDGAGNKVEGLIAREEPAQVGQRIVIGGGQPLDPSRRAGMMTTQWFLAFYSMFSALPRNAASQTYREYLGMDIAKGEGLMPVVNEPRDVDFRNVKQPDCAVCHSTLDPLSYAFSTYVGIETVQAFLFNTNGTYRATRSVWEGQGQLFGQPVANLLEWADKARNSEPFRKNLAKMFFVQALSREPLPSETQEFEALWKALPDDGYSANKLIHRLIDTKAFGGRRS